MKKLTIDQIKKKKYQLDHAAWMNRPSHPLPVFKPGESVEIYKSFHWIPGIVAKSTPGNCVVIMDKTDESMSIYDARLIRPSLNIK